MKNYIKIPAIVVAGFATGLFTHSASAQLFQSQMNSATGWSINASSSDYLATFGYDYSANSIPEAPHSTLGDTATSGLKLESNLALGALQSFTVFPTGQNFTGSYQLRFDAWMNYAGSATTEFLGGGIGYNNTASDVNSGAQAIATGDGGSASDWRAFKDGFFIPAGDMSGGTRQGSDPYYADFLPSVNGSVAGSPGFQWITWEFNVVGNIVSIYIEKPDNSRLELVSYDKTSTADGSSGVATDGNISLFYADFFSSLSDSPASQFGLIDNVFVTAVPEPSTLALALLGGIGLIPVFRRKK